MNDIGGAGPGEQLVPLRLLMIEDSDDDAFLIERQLRRGGLDPVTHRVESVDAMQAALHSVAWDAVICDYHLPQMDAQNALRIVHEWDPSLPFIVVSGDIDDETAVAMMESGAHDYVLKGNLARLAAALKREVAGRQREAAPHEAATAHDPRHLDDVSGLPDRRALVEAIERAARLRSDPPPAFPIIVIDIDALRIINSAFGYRVGDSVLRSVGATLRDSISPPGMAARIGDSRFGVLATTRGDPRTYAGRLKERCAGAMASGDISTGAITCSAGVAVFPENGRDAITVLAAAEAALRSAKASGAGGLAVAARGDSGRAQALEYQRARTLILDAIRLGRLRLARQEIRPITADAAGFWEVLLRIEDSAGKLILPGAFLPQADALGLISTIDQEVLQLAFRRWSAYRDAGMPLRLSLNVSPASIGPGLAELIAGLGNSVRADPAMFVIEITESAVLQNEDAAGEFAQAMRRAGYRLAMDDYGSGATSLRRLRELNFDILKLDSSLVAGVASDESHREFLRSIVSLAHAQEMEVVGEFVDTPETMDALTAVGADYAQGYLIGRPTPFPENPATHPG